MMVLGVAVMLLLMVPWTLAGLSRRNGVMRIAPLPPTSSRP
jgi:hypothetical protein